MRTMSDDEDDDVLDDEDFESDSDLEGDLDDLDADDGEEEEEWQVARQVGTAGHPVLTS